MEEKLIAEYRREDGRFRYELFETPGYHLLNQCGVLALEDAKHLSATLSDLGKRLGKRYPVLMPLPPEFADAEPAARNHMSDVVLGEDSPFSKFAIVGGSFLMRTLFNFYGRISKVPMRQFVTRDEAVAWLGQ